MQKGKIQELFTCSTAVKFEVKFKKASPKLGSQKASVRALVQEIKSQAKRQNRGGEIGHLKRRGEICMQNALEKVNDKHHDDDFA